MDCLRSDVITYLMDVIPVKTGIQIKLGLDSRFRGNDKRVSFDNLRCKNRKRCLQFCGIEIIDKLFHWGEIVDAFVRFDRIVPVHESDQFLLPVNSALESRLPMPHLQNRAYHPFRFAIRSWGPHLRESLLNMIIGTELHEGVDLGVSPILTAIISVHLFNGVGTFSKYLGEEAL